jgi:hypothetical protein
MNALTRKPFVFALVALALAGLVACGPSGAEEEADGLDPAAREAEVADLEQRQQELQAERDELRAARQRIEAREAQEGDAEIDFEARGAELAAAGEQLGMEAAEFINADPPVVGEPMGPLNQRAFDIKAREDIVLAQEYIEQGGDYGRAIRIYEDILSMDEDNELALAAKADAEGMRYANDERFAQVEQGMTQAQVREIMGVPFHRNVREYPEQNTVLWTFPRGGGQPAVGVYFRERNGQMQAFRLENAIGGQGEEE